MSEYIPRLSGTKESTFDIGPTQLNTNGSDELEIRDISADDLANIAVAGIRMPTGAAVDKVLTSDADGNASWEDAPSGGGGGGGDVVTTTKEIITETLLWKKTLGSTDQFDTNDTPDYGSTDLSGYTHLKVRIYGRSSTGSNTVSDVHVYFNNDTTSSNYRSETYFGSNLAGNNSFIGHVTTSNSVADDFGYLEFTVPDYESEDTTKTLLLQTAGRRNASDFTHFSGGVNWENTDAITRIQAETQTGLFEADSWMEVIGVTVEEVVTDVSGGTINPLSLTTTSIQTHTTLWKKTLGSTGDFDTNDTPDVGDTDLSGYDHIIIRGQLRSSTAATQSEDVRIYLNNNTTSSNYLTAMHFGGATHSGNQSTASNMEKVSAGSSPSGAFSDIYCQINDYEGSQRKAVHFRNDNVRTTSVRYQMSGFIYFNHADGLDPVDRIAIEMDTQVFDTGSWIEIIGVKSVDIVTDVTGAPEFAHSDDDVSSPPTKAELTTAFGDPATLEDGYIGVLDDDGAGTTVYLVAVSSDEFFYQSMTKAT